MDKRRRDGPHGKSSAASPRASDTSFEVWHSTPVKNNVGVLPADVSKVSVRSSNEMDGMVKQLARSVPPYSNDIHCQLQHQHTQMSVVSDMESSTIQRQRRELQLLITELKDRDRELNTMAASHHKQLHAWEQDRQRVLSLEQRCARSDGELQKHLEVIRALTRHVRVVEAREKDLQTELSTTQQHLQRLGQDHQDMEQTSQDLQYKNESLNSTVMALSSQVGSLQVREEELSSMLKLKDKDVSEAATHTADLTGRLQDLEAALKESRSRETRLVRDIEETKRRYREMRHENTNLREELQQHVTQSSAQREEIIRLKQEHQMLCRDLALSGEGDTWKDDLLVLARSKQERTESELHCLRQVCENQQNDLQLLRLNLETAREALGERSRQESVGREDTVMESLWNILEISREQQQSPSIQVIDVSFTAKENIPNVFPSVITWQKEQRELEESISGSSLDATDAPMMLWELVSDSSATCYLFPGQTSEGRRRLPEHGRAPNCNTPSFHSEPVSCNSHQEDIEGKVLGQGQQERSTTETTVTADIQSGCSTSFEPKCGGRDGFIIIADDSDVNGGSIPHETPGETMKLDSEEIKCCSVTRTIRSPARSSEWTGEAQDQAESCTSETSNPGPGHASLEDVVSSSSEIDGFRERCAPEENQTELLPFFGSAGHQSRAEQTEDRFKSNRTFVPSSSPSSYGRGNTVKAISFKIVASGCRIIRGALHYRSTTGGGGVEGVGEPEPGDGYDAQADVGRGPQELRSAPEGKSSLVLSLEVRPPTPQDHDHTRQDDSLPSSLRMRSCCLANGAIRPATADEAPELLSHASIDGRHPFASCCLQRVLDDPKCGVLQHKGSAKNRDALVSLNLSHDSGSSESSHCHTCPKSPSYGRSSTDKVTQTPPKA